MKIHIQGYIDLTKEQFNEVSVLLEEMMPNHKVTYCGVVVEKMWLTKKEKKKINS